HTAGGSEGSSYHPLNPVHELPTTVPQRVRRGKPVLGLVGSHGLFDFVPRHILVVDSEAKHLALPRDPREKLQPFDLFVYGRHRPSHHVAAEAAGLPGRCVHHEDPRRHGSVDDRSGSTHVCRMGDTALTLHDDHLRFRLLMGADDFRLELADHEISFDGVERHAVGGTLHEAGLPGSVASFRLATIGMPLASPPSTWPAWPPAFVWSITPTIS